MSKKWVERLMEKAGIYAVSKKKYRATTDSKHSHAVAVNHLNRNFKVDKLKQVLGSRYHLYLYPGRLALPVDYYGSVFP